MINLVQSHSASSAGAGLYQAGRAGTQRPSWVRGCDLTHIQPQYHPITYWSRNICSAWGAISLSTGESFGVPKAFRS